MKRFKRLVLSLSLQLESWLVRSEGSWALDLWGREGGKCHDGLGFLAE